MNRNEKKSFISQDLNKNTNQKMKNNQINCSICSKIIAKASYSRHRKRNHPNFYFPRSSKETTDCPICKTTISKNNMRHIKRYHFQHSSTPLNELKIMFNENFTKEISKKKADCPICKTTRSKNNIRRHIRRYHSQHSSTPLNELKITFNDNLRTEEITKDMCDKCMICGVKIRRKNIRRHIRLYH